MLVLILQSVCLLVLTAGILWYYPHQSTPLYVRILVFLSLNLSFACFLIMPMDIYETSLTDSISPHIRLAWAIVYDINFVVCWLVLPLVQEYEDSGQFTTIGRLKEALKTNGIMMAAIVGGAVVLVVYLVIVGKFTISQLPAVFATIVNGFGLCLVSVTLGFGLVSFPKENYAKIDYKKRVAKCHRMAEMLKSEQQLIKEQVLDVKRILEQRQRTGDTDGHEAAIIYLIEQNIDVSNFRSYAEPSERLPKLNNPALHTIIKKRIIQYNACQSQLDEYVDELRDISHSFAKNTYTRSKVLYIFMFTLTTVVSVLVFLAETSTFISVFEYVNVLSLVDWASPASYMLNCLLTFYVVYIVTHTVFRIKLYRVFSLHKKHSSSSSLTFTAINLARICYPLCFNYLQITRIQSTAFLSFFGDMNVNTDLAFVFPLLMLVFGLFNLLDIYDTIMGYLGLGSYAFDEEDAQEKAEEGQRILVDRLKERNIENHKMEMIQLL